MSAFRGVRLGREAEVVCSTLGDLSKGSLLYSRGAIYRKYNADSIPTHTLLSPLTP